MSIVFSLAAFSNNLVGSFPYKYVMLVITNVIELRMGKLILNHLIGNNYPEFRNGLLDSYFFKVTLGSDCLELCFSAPMPSLIQPVNFLLNLGFVCSSLTYTKKK